MVKVSQFCRKIFCHALTSAELSRSGRNSVKSEISTWAPNDCHQVRGKSKVKEKTFFFFFIPTFHFLPVLKDQEVQVRVGVIRPLCRRTLCSNARTDPAFEDWRSALSSSVNPWSQKYGCSSPEQQKQEHERETLHAIRCSNIVWDFFFSKSSTWNWTQHVSSVQCTWRNFHCHMTIQ